MAVDVGGFGADAEADRLADDGAEDRLPAEADEFLGAGDPDADAAPDADEAVLPVTAPPVAGPPVTVLETDATVDVAEAPADLSADAHPVTPSASAAVVAVAQAAPTRRPRVPSMSAP